MTHGGRGQDCSMRGAGISALRYVREEIAAGNMEKGNELLLGYAYFRTGDEIVHGNQIWAATIGMPTINLIPPEDKLLPKNGVYVTKIEIEHHIYHGVTNVGVKPTVTGENQMGIETHIFDLIRMSMKRTRVWYFFPYP